MSVEREDRNKPMNILIAEDDFTSRSILATCWKSTGYEVVATTNGAEASAAMQAAAEQLAMLDSMMPEMNGIEDVARIRRLETGSAAYIVMLMRRERRKDNVAGLERVATTTLPSRTTPMSSGPGSASADVWSRCRPSWRRHGMRSHTRRPTIR